MAKIRMQRGFAPVIFLIIAGVLALGAGGGAYYYKVRKDKQKETETSQQQAGQQQISTSTANSSADIPADWKTYRNEKYGVEFKYPSDWKINESDGEKYSPVNGIKKVEVNKILCCGASFDEGMSLKVIYSTDYSKYPDMQNLLAEEKKGYSLENFAVNKYAAGNFEGVSVKTKTGSNSIYQENIQLYSKTGVGFYTALWHSSDPNRKGFTAQAYLEKILSTFKFIDETSDWKIYKNEKLGFEFKYPQDFKFEQSSKYPNLLESIVLRPPYKSYNSFVIESFKGIVPQKADICMREENVVFGRNYISTKLSCADAGASQKEYYIPLKEKGVFLKIILTANEMPEPSLQIPENIIQAFFNSFQLTR